MAVDHLFELAIGKHLEIAALRDLCPMQHGSRMQTFHHLGRDPIIGIDKGDVLALRCRQSRHPRRRAAAIGAADRSDTIWMAAGPLIGDHTGAIDRAVIHHNDFDTR